MWGLFISTKNTGSGGNGIKNATQEIQHGMCSINPFVSFGNACSLSRMPQKAQKTSIFRDYITTFEWPSGQRASRMPLCGMFHQWLQGSLPGTCLNASIDCMVRRLSQSFRCINCYYYLIYSSFNHIEDTSHP